MRGKPGRFSSAVQATARALRAVIGPDECAIYAALGLLGAGCWQLSHAAGLIVPALFMVWMYLPPRGSFVESLPERKGTKS